MEQKKSFLSAVFCAPTGPWEQVPDRLTDEVFEALRAAGVNRIFAFGMDSRPETVAQTFRQCEKFGIGYLPCVPAAQEYCRILPDKHGKPWGALTSQEQAALDERFVAQVRPFLEEPAFRGIMFEDECGYLAFDGVAHAKRVFDAHFPGYEFHANFFSYSINPEIFWGGMAFHENPELAAGLELPFALEGDMAITFANRFRYYDVLVEGLLSKAHFELISQDKYPFEEFWPEVPTSVHTALFELNAFLKQKSMEHGCRFYNFMQVGQWARCRRKMSFGEMALQVNVTVAYGAEGFGWFPGVFPLDWRNDPNAAEGAAGGAAFIDLCGRPTRYAQWAAVLQRFLESIADDILRSELLGVASYGTYDNGFDLQEVRSLPDAECIYCGELPDILRYTDERIGADCGNQLLLASFERDGKRRYYAVNLSSVYDNPITLRLPAGTYSVCSLDGETTCTDTLTALLPPGCALYIKQQ